MIAFGSRRFRHAGGVAAIATAPDRQRVAASAPFADDTAVWDLGRGERLLSIPEPADRLSWSSDGSLLTVAYARVEVWNVATGRRVATIADAKSPALFVRDDRIAVRDTAGRGVRLVSLGDERQQQSLAIPDARDLACSPDGRLLSIVDDQKVWRLVDLETGSSKELGNAELARFATADVLIGGAEDHLRALRVDDGGELWRTESERIEGLAVSPTGTQVAACDTWDAVVILDVATGRSQASLELHRSDQAIEFVGEQTLLGAHEGTLVAYDASTGRRRDEPRSGHDGAITAVAVSAKARRVVTASVDHTARCWDVDDGTELLTVRHDNAIGAVAITADGSHIATSSADDTARVWNAAGEQVARFDNSRSLLDGCCIAFSPDQQLLAFDRAKGVALASVESDTPERVLRLDESPLAVEFLTNGEVVVVTPARVVVVDIDGHARCQYTSLVPLRPVLAVDGGGRLIAIADEERIRVLKRRGDELATVIERSAAYCLDLALCPEGLLAGLNVARIDLFDLRDPWQATGVATGPYRCIEFVPGRHELVVGRSDGTAETIELPETRRMAGARAQRRLEERTHQAVAAVRQVAARGSSGGYRSTATPRGIDPDGFGVTLDEGTDAPAVLRIDVSAAGFTIDIRAGVEPAPAPPRGVLDRLAAWMKRTAGMTTADDGAIRDASFVAEILGSEAARGARWTATKHSASLALELSELPPAAELRQLIHRVRSQIQAEPPGAATGDLR
jgi:WD40 repeat protein